MSLRLIIQLLQRHCGSPSEVLVAAGHGRSYGQNSQVLVRELPGIVRSGLWRQFYSEESQRLLQPNYAFLTDIGNDILYGFSSAQILHWVAWCIHRLHGRSARIVMTNLPMASIASLSERRFKLLRNLFYPSCRLSRNEVVDRAWAVHQGLNELTKRYPLTVHEPDPQWMSMDSIHVSFWKRYAYYEQLFTCFANTDSFSRNHVVPVSKDDDLKPLLLPWRRRPQFAVRKVLGKIKHVSQPSGYFDDQTSVSLY
ncbi:hypothetical protein C8R11_11096 [Nitrosomonas aestuarii]|nr:hypothetical protein C8R11_11096 [Nitrosomonas aestuarii]